MASTCASSRRQDSWLLNSGGVRTVSMLKGCIGNTVVPVTDMVKILYSIPNPDIQSYSQMMIGMSNHLLSIGFRFHYHSQKVIGSPGWWVLHDRILSSSLCYFKKHKLPNQFEVWRSNNVHKNNIRKNSSCCTRPPFCSMLRLTCDL